MSPESGSVNVRTRGVMFDFDAVTSDRSSGGGAGELDNLFLLSPQDGRPRVIWRRDRIEVRPRRAFRPNTSYSVTLLPGLSDLRGNTMRIGRTVVFSTGPTIAPYFVHGRVFDWATERSAPRSYVEVVRLPDSLRYVGSADSTGQFAVGPLDAGTYAVRAIIDANNNRGLDPGEMWDSLTIAVRGTSPFVELLAAARDTIAPRLLTVSVIDSLTLMANFDRALDPGVPLTPQSFRVEAADSTRLRITRVMPRAEYEAGRTPRDTARDTTRVIRPPPVVDPRAVPPPVEARPSRPAPVRDVVISVDSAAPLRQSASYRVTAVNARGLTGSTRTSDRVITVPRPAPRDTTRRAAPRDTTRPPPL